MEDVAILADGGTVLDYLDSHAVQECPALFLSDGGIAELATCPVNIRNVPIGGQTLQSKLFVPSFPTLSSLQRWRSEGVGRVEIPGPGVVDAEEDPDLGPLLAMPPKRSREEREEESFWQGASRVKQGKSEVHLGRRIDPVKQILALGFSQHLRAQISFSDALQAAEDYERDVAEEDAVARDPLTDPSESALASNVIRLDPVACLLTRREFAQYIKDDSLEAVNLYSDGSPVCGAELQGMIMDIHLKNGEQRQLTLPGSMLQYGHTDWISKGVALVWSVSLVVGFELPALEYVFSKVRSMTTDYGVELKCALMSNILPAFVQWVRGAPLNTLQHRVQHDVRLMPKGLRIGGWGHSLGNTMKEVCKRFPSYPTKLTAMRELCRFFRNETHRLHLRRVMRRLGHPDELCDSLKTFTAKLAKWRYETLYEVARQLLILRPFCENHMQRQMLGQVEDESLLAHVIATCRDPSFWRWLEACFQYVLMPLEKLRRWSTVCQCHEEERRTLPRSSWSKCFQNGRRLREAYQRVKDEVNVFHGLANNLTVEDCEGDVDLHTCIINALRYAVMQLNQRFKYLKALPWCLALADTVEGALRVLTKYRALPRDRHDPVTLNIVDSILDDLILRSEGGDCSVALEREVRLVNTACLDESAGEGWHRGTNLEKIRAPGAKLSHLKGAPRFKASIQRIKSFLYKHKRKGRDAIRSDWYRFKRVLQADPKRKWAPVRMDDKTFYARFYRTDDKSLEDWSPLVRSVDLAKPVVAAPAERPTMRQTNDAAMKKEYYRAVFKPDHYYSIRRRVERMGEAGEPVMEHATEFFQVIKVHEGSSRIHIINTVESVEDKAENAPFALCIQMLDVWREADDSRHVYADSDQVWALPEDLGHWLEIAEGQMQLWQTVRASEFDGCQCLSSPGSAEPVLALTDAACPTHMVVRELRNRGWKSLNRQLTHTTANSTTLICNNNGGVRIKFYLQCLVDLDRSLTLTSALPTHQPQAYYRLLLMGKMTEPYLGDKAYKALVAGRDVPAIADAPGPELPAPAPVAALGGGDEMVLPRRRRARAVVPAVLDLEPAPPSPESPVAHPEPPPPKAKASAPAPPPPAPVVVIPAAAAKGIAIPAAAGAGPGPEVDEVVVPRRRRANAKPKPKARPKATDAVDGGEILYQVYTPPDEPEYSNWILTWTTEGRRYQKKRLCTVDSQRRHGYLEPIAYLHAFKAAVQAGNPEYVSNIRKDAPDDMIDAMMALHSEEFERIAAVYLTP